MMGIVRPFEKGTTHRLPMNDLNRSSAGFTATAVSPKMVSGRVVATGRYAPSPSPPSTGYLK